jgi:predicted nucleic acid-binding protein
MKPRVFLDTNIMLDLLLDRPGCADAARVLQLQEDGKITACLSILSMANLAYVLRKTVSPLQVIPTLKQISAIVKVVPMDDRQLQRSLFLEGPDFEDILQAVCASENGCECILTRNARDFRIGKGLSESADLPLAETPQAFLARFEA